MAKAPRLSAGVVVVRETADDGVRFLLLRAYRNWDFPKGLVKRREEPMAAALRETAEETGIGDLELAWGEDYIETAPYADNKVARYYLARTNVEHVVFGVNPAIRRREHHEYRWAGLIEAVALVPARLQPVIAWAARKVTAQMRG